MSVRLIERAIQLAGALTVPTYCWNGHEHNGHTILKPPEEAIGYAIKFLSQEAELKKQQYDYLWRKYCIKKDELEDQFRQKAEVLS